MESPRALHALYESESARRKLREQAATAIHCTLERATIEAGDTYVVDGRPEEALPSLARKLRAQDSSWERSADAACGDLRSVSED